MSAKIFQLVLALNFIGWGKPILVVVSPLTVRKHIGSINYKSMSSATDQPITFLERLVLVKNLKDFNSVEDF